MDPETQLCLQCAAGFALGWFLAALPSRLRRKDLTKADVREAVADALREHATEEKKEKRRAQISDDCQKIYERRRRGM